MCANVNIMYMMMETAREVAQMDVQGIKIHLLHLLKGTPMVKQYEKGMLEFMSQEDYTPWTSICATSRAVSIIIL
jgi:radical SAM superfamily enzyme